MHASFSTRPSMPLFPGSIWRGSQRSGSHEYDVEIRICNVDELGDVSGTLTIRNLTPSLPKLVTFFNGEIIGPHHSFATDKWEATEQDDDTHWKRFGLELPSCYPWSEDRSAFRDDITFLRLKERCIINESRDDGFLSDTSGASFSGFYYIALELNPSAIAAGSGERAGRAVEASPFGLAETRSSSLESESRSRPAAPALARSGSYASVVVRGRSPSPPPHGSSFSKSEEEGLNVTVAAVPTSPQLSEEEYPLPCSPATAVAPVRHGDFFGQAHHEQRRGRSRSSSQSSSASSDASFASSAHHPVTGYRGPWANAVMRGFYFASTSEPFQELKLHYVGDGMGMIREEQEDEDHALNYGGADPQARARREQVRRQAYSAPRASASFEMM